jgi:hypothetical protein
VLYRRHSPLAVRSLVSMETYTQGPLPKPQIVAHSTTGVGNAFAREGDLVGGNSRVKKLRVPAGCGRYDTSAISVTDGTNGL